jgi:hydrogenase expression/formation protein HypC
MKIESITGEFAQVQTGSLRRQVNIQMLRGVRIGDYVIVHAGFAIQRIDPKEAKETLRIINEIH